MNLTDQPSFSAGMPISASALNALAQQIRENSITVAAPLKMTKTPYGTALSMGDGSGSAKNLYINSAGSLTSNAEPGVITMFPSLPSGVYQFVFRLQCTGAVYSVAGASYDGMTANVSVAGGTVYPSIYYDNQGFNAAAPANDSFYLMCSGLLIVPSSADVILTASLSRGTSARSYSLGDIAAIKVCEYTDLTTTDL